MINPKWHRQMAPDPNFKFVKQYFRLGCKGVLLNDKKEMLVLWSSNLDPAHPGRVDLPGGGVDHGETPFETARREAYEELGIEIKNVQIISASHHEDPTIDNNDHVIMFWFMAEFDCGEISLSWEHDKFAWMKIDEVLEQSGWPPPHKAAIVKAKEILASQ